MKHPIFLTLLILWTKGREVLAVRMECLTHSAPTMCATSYLQPAGEGFTVPAIIRPLEPIHATPAVTSIPNYGTCSWAQSPVVVSKDDDDDFYQFLYFLIYALKNRQGGGNGNSWCGGCGGNPGCGCGGWGGNSGCGCDNWGYGNCGCGGYGCGGGCGYGGGCGCGCGGFYPYDNSFNPNMNGINNSGNDVVYIPYPIAIPMNSPYSFSDMFSTPDPEPSNCKEPNEINLIIRTECGSQKDHHDCH